MLIKIDLEDAQGRGVETFIILSYRVSSLLRLYKAGVDADTCHSQVVSKVISCASQRDLFQLINHLVLGEALSDDTV